MNPSDPKWRDTVAMAVHRAVTDYTEDDGFRHCDLYALAGLLLLREITDTPYQLQLGSLMYLADPADNGWFEINARDGGLDRLEYHAWLGCAGAVVRPAQGDKPALHEVGELIDFSTRHLKTMVNRMQGIVCAIREGDDFLVTVDPFADRIRWTRDHEPPDYLWTTGNTPDEFRYTPDAASIVGYYSLLKQHPNITLQLRRLVLGYYKEITS